MRDSASCALLLLVALILAGPAGMVGAADYTFTTVDFPSSPETLLRKINNHGVIVGEYGAFDFQTLGATGNHGFVLQDGQYRTIDYPGALSTSVEGINDAGQMVGTYYDASMTFRGYSLDGDTWRQIMVPGAYDTFVTGINNAATIIGYYTTTASRDSATGFLYDGHNFQSIVVNGSPSTYPLDINDSGQIAGTFMSGFAASGFRRDGDSVALVSHPDGFSTEARGINNDGVVAGVYRGYTLSSEGFTWDGTGYSDGFAFPGVAGPFGTGDHSLPVVSDINNAATIVGYYDNSDGVYHGFIGRLPASLPGDANGDGRVDQTDALALATNWGQSGANWQKGDFNGDFAVNAADASILAANWGHGTSEATAVPEPGGLALLIGIVVTGLVYRRRRAA